MTRLRSRRSRRGSRPGGRSARVRSSVLQSAFELLVRKGIEAFSIAEVAAQSGVHATSIYRRWGTKDALVREACLHQADVALPIPDTGSLRSDLVALLDRLVAWMASRQGQVLLALSSSQHPHVVSARRNYWRRRFDLIRPVFEKAKARGEFPRQTDPIEFLEMLIAPLYLRALMTAERVEAWPRKAMLDRLLALYMRPVPRGRSRRS
jgi:AcrR family transcriptional regulator